MSERATNMMKPKETVFRGIKCIVTFSHQSHDKEWPCFVWNVLIGNEQFSYRTGLGHATPYFNRITWLVNRKPENSFLFHGENHIDYKNDAFIHIPKIESVLECLFLDASCIDQSFSNFCADCGYDTDSMKAFKIYQACQDNAEKLRKALGKEYTNVQGDIEKLNEVAS